MGQGQDVSKKMKDYADMVVADALEIMKEEIAFQIEHHYELYIDKFYAHYPDPVWYDPRTYSTYLASDSYNSLAVAINKKKNRVGIYVSPSFIDGNPYYVKGKYGQRKNGNPVDKDWVFTNTFAFGRHGYPPYEGKKPMGTSPYTNMQRWFDDFKNNETTKQKIITDALMKAVRKHLR